MTSFLSKFKVGYEDIWKGIIRPPREEYEIKDLGKIVYSLKSSIIFFILYFSRSERIQIKKKSISPNRFSVN